ncbi:class I SAM-dependent methyltransferase [Brevibacillus daliensis]|uniref:class I SAM-dependent methyltransferase n=1 Tax=Brevibacillus daliensis TaxID=2892995 RepID=UPI001E3C39DB|nr:class I SAM-dependent methyltransferase [Brevibacillus daliensis]
MIVTTNSDPKDEVRKHAEDLAQLFQAPLVKRGDDSVERLQFKYQTDDILIVTTKGARLERKGQPAFFFHPNTASFRIKRLERGDNDIMLSVCQIKPGDAILDATLGLGADSIVFAYGAGPQGKVVGIESEPMIAKLVRDGLKHWTNGTSGLLEAMRRVQVIEGNHSHILSSYPDNSFDVVYFDPMFTSAVSESNGISTLRYHANESAVTMATIEEALRVARRRVVLKEEPTGTLHEQLRFTPYRKREHQVIYSYIDKMEGS